MKFKLEIDCDNAAFQSEGWGQIPRDQEIARILRTVADRAEKVGFSTGGSWALVDANGNRCGIAKLNKR